MRKEEQSEITRGALSQEVEILIPTSIFCNRRLSVLEALVIFLREQHRLRFSEIAEHMNRDQRNVWAAYYNGLEKDPEAFLPRGKCIFFPLGVVRDRSLSIFESIVEHLREETRLRNADVARLLERDPRTISTVYNRAMGKREEQGGGEP